MFTKPFNQLSKHDAAVAGGKGASLGEMTRAGIPVPPGFVVVADAFEHFLEETDLNVEIEAILKKVDHQNVYTVERASEKIQAMIEGAKMPEDIELAIHKAFSSLRGSAKQSPMDPSEFAALRRTSLAMTNSENDKEFFVAVRSSATAEDSASAAWAGQLESYLNTTNETLLVNVQKCWASLFTPRAIFYRFEKGLNAQKISVAVAVQKMVQSEVAGIAFSVHPVTQDRNQLIIEAGIGLGEAVVSGQITPDSYVVSKKDLQILDKNVSEQARALRRSSVIASRAKQSPEIATPSARNDNPNQWVDLGPKGAKQKLSDSEILELSKLIIHIENHYGFPVDVEWAREGGKFYIVQSRPITTLTDTPADAVVMITPYDTTKKWIPYLTRPFSLFAASLWHLWYDSNQIQDLLSVRMPDTLFIEEQPHVVRRYQVEDQLQTFKGVIKNIVTHDAEKMLVILKRGKVLNEQAKKYLKQGPKAFTTLDQAIDFLIDLALHATIFPYWAVLLLEELGIKNKQIRALAEELRSTSYYPNLVQQIIEPLAAKLHKDFEFLTVRELLDSDTGKISERLTLRERGKHFVYQIVDGRERVTWKDEVTPLIIDLEGISDTDSSELRGQTAYPGKVRGTARVIFSSDGAGAVFNKGDILISISSNPNLLPLLKKSAAIVTNEGGVTCHAAIISRELKKPCVIGTKIATKVLKDGDEVEVDADQGIVKILNRKNTQDRNKL
ncbi:hypothetical protein EXS71_02855 [Candidatus Uhrbacteria bacterium]|nr:hypothetical protein [Candidatus Uhrbacteria bacterium]